MPEYIDLIEKIELGGESLETAADLLKILLKKVLAKITFTSLSFEIRTKEKEHRLFFCHNKHIEFFCLHQLQK